MIKHKNTNNNQSQAVYKLAKTHPNHPSVKQAIADSLRRVVKIHPLTPGSMRSWLKTYANKFHGGLGQTLPEYLADAIKHIAALKVYKFDEGVTAARESESAACHAPCWDFIDKRFKGVYSSKEAWMHTRVAGQENKADVDVSAALQDSCLRKSILKEC